MSARHEAVVVTGLGATTPIGGDVATFWAGLLAGRSGVVALTGDRYADLSVRIGAPMAVDPAEVLPRVQARRLDRSEQAAMVAARQAWADAGFEGKAAEAGLDPTRVAVVIGTGIGGVTSLLAQYDILLDRGPDRVSPLLIPMNMPNGPAAYVGLDVGAQAGVHTTVSACASGSEAIAHGLDLIHLDRADVVVVGGTEACIHPLNIAGFAKMQAMSRRNDEPQRASRPWDKARDGFVLGEGAGVLVIERASSAAARGRTPYAVLAGAGITSDAKDIVAPDKAGQVRALRATVERSGLSYDEVVHVNAHATSTPVGDMGEASALAELFGEDTVVTSTKSMTGHLLGAAGAIEAIATVLAVREDLVPPTINLDDPDDELRVDVPREPRKVTVTAAINDSFGFGGHNASLLFCKA
ncbi:beta-ketoacyl-[acyl-carrier-protein] synthase family protein [Jatrophihabitans cynanchi]|uniref:Beta-ketoacyl-[acyl-carrier-protein] synthase family protein n=1 Tax=Jatrophihabitans cynanchi TaxID=2944128 RepID=A0ABY7JVG6_9ACTN|nr:beta-ketoacyl-[acyl-carrier-protein] synthase family protein [Jatrophihabitans sp. SB3-54]WAX56531.1 beta-ketoacyl-[acyl-carrier-protein] synthase family protein [Jatrophihabitans sp. SB3-54]